MKWLRDHCTVWEPGSWLCIHNSPLHPKEAWLPKHAQSSPCIPGCDMELCMWLMSAECSSSGMCRAAKFAVSAPECPSKMPADET